MKHMSRPKPCAAQAHWTIYLPSLVVAALWAGVYAWAATREPALAGVKALALAVEALGLPVLLFFAAARARSLMAEVRGDGALHVRSGLTRATEVSVGLSEIASVRVRRSWVQRLMGGGALDVKTLSGERIMVNDLDRPEVVAASLVAPVAVDVAQPVTLH
jgi:uncharacterized membrane protein YdbT with pleckstrin-like domain